MITQPKRKTRHTQPTPRIPSPLHTTHTHKQALARHPTSLILLTLDLSRPLPHLLAHLRHTLLPLLTLGPPTTRAGEKDILLLGFYPAAASHRRKAEGGEGGEEGALGLSFSALAASWSQAAAAAVAMVEGSRAAAALAPIVAFPPHPSPPPTRKEEEQDGEALALARAAALRAQLMGHPEWAGVRERLVIVEGGEGERGRGGSPVALLPLYDDGAAEGEGSDEEGSALAVAAVKAAMRLSGRRKRHPAWCLRVWEGVERRLREQEGKAAFTGE